MKNYTTKKKTIKQDVLVSITCDKCKKEYHIDNWVEMQQFHHIDIRGRYGSVFGDESWVLCDLCQYCLKELIGDFCRISDY